MFTLLGALPVHRVLGHRGQARAPPPGPPAQRADPHRVRRRRRSRSTACCWSAAATTSSPRTSTCRSTRSPGSSGSRSSSSRARVHRHQADLPRPAAPRPGQGCCTAARPASSSACRTASSSRSTPRLDPEKIPVLVASRATDYRQIEPGPDVDENGVKNTKGRVSAKLGEKLSKFYFADRVKPVSPTSWSRPTRTTTTTSSPSSRPAPPPRAPGKPDDQGAALAQHVREAPAHRAGGLPRSGARWPKAVVEG